MTKRHVVAGYHGEGKRKRCSPGWQRIRGKRANASPLHPVNKVEVMLKIVCVMKSKIPLLLLLVSALFISGCQQAFSFSAEMEKGVLRFNLYRCGIFSCRYKGVDRMYLDVLTANELGVTQAVWSVTMGPDMSQSEYVLDTVVYGTTPRGWVTTLEASPVKKNQLYILGEFGFFWVKNNEDVVYCKALAACAELPGNLKPAS